MQRGWVQARADSLLHTQSSEADRLLIERRELRPVENWALPTVDLAASDERLADVRNVADSMHELVDDYEQPVVANEDGDSPRPMMTAPRQEVAKLLHHHMQNHDEAVSLLEGLNFDASAQLDRCIDDLEQAAVHTTRVADLQVSATNTALSQIHDSLQPNKRRPARLLVNGRLCRFGGAVAAAFPPPRKLSARLPARQ